MRSETRALRVVVRVGMAVDVRLVLGRHHDDGRGGRARARGGTAGARTAGMRAAGVCTARVRTAVAVVRGGGRGEGGNGVRGERRRGRALGRRLGPLHVPHAELRHL